LSGTPSGFPQGGGETLSFLPERSRKACGFTLYQTPRLRVISPAIVPARCSRVIHRLLRMAFSSSHPVPCHPRGQGQILLRRRRRTRSFVKIYDLGFSVQALSVSVLPQCRFQVIHLRRYRSVPLRFSLPQNQRLAKPLQNGIEVSEVFSRRQERRV
jgi:hypothetical protein